MSAGKATLWFLKIPVLIWLREWDSGVERTEGEEMDGKVLGWLEEARKGVKGDGLACWQQIEVTRFKWEWERVKMNLAVADSNRVRNVKEGGEDDDRSLSMTDGFYLQKHKGRPEHSI